MKKKEEETSIYKEYFDSTIEYTQKHGDKTIVFMQVGSFYEMYGLKYIGSEEIKGSLIVEIADIVGLAVSSKKYTYEGGTLYMAGFRDYTLEKYIPTIIEHGYVIVEIIQEVENNSEVTNKKKKTRILNAVYSAGTYLTYDSPNLQQRLTNNIMCIWMETSTEKKTTKKKIIYGVAVLNIYTGESFIFEHETENWMNPTMFDELERYISIYSPSEMIFIYSLLDNTIDKIIQFIKPPTNMVLHKINLLPPPFSKTEENIQIENAKKCTKQKYIQYMLSSFFGEETYSLCSEFSYHIYATQAYCYLLHFIQEHNSNFGKKVILPIFQNITEKMRLANHTLKQLNIINDYSEDGRKQGQLSSVLSFLNKCKTAMGKRAFQTQLTQPVSNTIWLNREYEMIAYFLGEEQTDIVDCFRKQLMKVKDIDKINRQLLCRKIYPAGLFDLYQSIFVAQQIAECMYEMPKTVLDYFFVMEGEKEKEKDKEKDKDMREILTFFETKMKIEVCNGYNSLSSFPDNLFCKGISLELDEKIKNYEIKKQKLEKIHAYFTNECISSKKEEDTTEYIKISETDKNGISFTITKTRGDLLLKKLQKQNKNPSITIEDDIVYLKDIKINHGKSTSEIEFPLLDKTCQEITSLKNQIQKIISNLFLNTLNEIEDKYYDKIGRISKFVSKIDVILCKTYLAKTYRYCRPQIEEKESNNSFVEAKDLRHVLIEHLQQNEIYVANDICIGKKGISTTGISTTGISTGMLLYGTNAVGKTSLIRALGISLIMAQSGMYVPCSSFQYKPYTAMYSRILSNDNLFKGLSTFAVEISELRVILMNADANSFVLGDELCSGTETESALGIFMSSLYHLHEKQTSFIFATHFHEITDYEELQNLPRITLKHLEVRYDRETDSLIYDRKIKDGIGNRMYGLEVCKSLYLPDHIIEYAYQIRNKYASNPVNDNGSLSHTVATKYNARKIRGICEKCRKKMGEEIHHVQPQKEADENGFLRGEWVHKNHPANLISLCADCHDEMHVHVHEDIDDEISEMSNSPSIFLLSQKKTKKISVK
jgi:DNA mismatch repair protein MutS